MVNSSKRGEALAAAEAILKRGELLTYNALARELGVTWRMALSRVYRYRTLHRWPHTMHDLRCVRNPELTPGSVACLAAVDAIRARGGRVTYDALGAEMGVTGDAASWRVYRLRDLGIWPEGVKVSPPEPKGDRPRPTPDVWVPDPEAIAGIAARAAAIGLQKVAEAIDGRSEVDDPRHGLPPRSRWRPVPVVPPDVARAREVRGYLAEWKQIVGRP